MAEADLPEDLYRLLGLSSSATDQEIGQAYRRLARRFHPDASPGEPVDAQRFRDLSAAYEVLGDPSRREQYDDTRGHHPPGSWRAAPRHDFPAEERPGRTRPMGVPVAHRADRRVEPGAGRPPLFDAGGGPSRRGVDLQAELRLSFDEAVLGTTASLQVRGRRSCPSCQGHGIADRRGSACDECGGTGTVVRHSGSIVIRQQCRGCDGRGTMPPASCTTCGGQGEIDDTRQLAVNVPAGVDEGARLRLPGRGGPGHGTGAPGDLYAVVRVDPHPLFGRHGRDLTLKVPVSLAEAVLGAAVKVPGLGGPPLTVHVPPGTAAGQVLRVRGRGVPAGDRPGDLLLTIDVVIPKSVSESQRQALQAYADADDQSPRGHWPV